MRRIARSLGCGVLTTAVLALAAPTVLAAEPPTVGGYATGGPTIAAATDAQVLFMDATVPSTDVQPPQRGRLPFTGLQVAIMVVAGLCLAGLGIGLRRSQGTTSAASGSLSSLGRLGG